MQLHKFVLNLINYLLVILIIKPGLLIAEIFHSKKQ